MYTNTIPFLYILNRSFGVYTFGGKMGTPEKDAATEIPKPMAAIVPQKLARKTTKPIATGRDTFAFSSIHFTAFSKYRDTPKATPNRIGRTMLLKT